MNSKLPHDFDPDTYLELNPDVKAAGADAAKHFENGKWNYKNSDIVHYDGLDVKIVRQQYGESLGWAGFCGGHEEYSYWIEKNDLLTLLAKLGYSKIETAFDDVKHQNGPSFCVLAQK